MDWVCGAARSGSAGLREQEESLIGMDWIGLDWLVDLSLVSAE